MREVNIMEEDWDYCVILDACRPGFFKNLIGLRGHFEERLSVAPSTDLWRDRTFPEEHYDLIYISANPVVSEYLFIKDRGFVPFLRLDEVWDYGWDRESRTIFPSTVTKAFFKNLNNYPDKKMIVHYLQPHFPYVNGPIEFPGRGVTKEVVEGKGNIEDQEFDEVVFMYIGKKVSRDQVRLGYVMNLQLVLEGVARLVKAIPSGKKVVITSDHNELLGYKNEKPKVFGHGPSLDDYRDSKRIPWFRMEK